jgi:hypothetical protein
MSKFKDWVKGECRVKIEVILEDGCSLKYYLPHVAPALGHKAIEVANEIATTPPNKAKKYPRVYSDGCAITTEKPDPKAIAKDFLEAGPLGFTVNVEERTPCPTCEGKGFINGSCCRKCEGSMSINKEGFEKP